jgi:hypothetical protein
MFTARAASNTITSREISAWIIISALAHRDNTGTLVLAGSKLGRRIHRHLRKQKCAVGMTLRAVALMWSSPIQTPIPRSKNQDVCYPEGRGGAQQLLRAYLMISERLDQQSERQNHSQGNETIQDVTDQLI